MQSTRRMIWASLVCNGGSHSVAYYYLQAWAEWGKKPLATITAAAVDPNDIYQIENKFSWKCY